MPPEYILQEAGPKVYIPTDPGPSCPVPLSWELVNTGVHRGLKRSSCLFSWSPLSFPIPAGLKTQPFPLGCVLSVLAEKEQQESAPPAATGPPQVVFSGTPFRDFFKHAQTVEGAAKPAWDYSCSRSCSFLEKATLCCRCCSCASAEGAQTRTHSQFQR